MSTQTVSQQSLFGTRRQKDIVTLSGVPCKIQEFDSPTKARWLEKAHEEAVPASMYANLIVQLGNIDNVTETVVKSMSMPDLEHILFEVCVLSMLGDPDKDGYRVLSFDYTFKESKKKESSEEVHVYIDDHNFKQTPAKWVLDKISKDKEEALEEGTQMPNYPYKWPAVYDSYADMMAEQKTQYFEMERGIRASFQMLTYLEAKGLRDLYEGQERDGFYIDIVNNHRVHLYMPDNAQELANSPDAKAIYDQQPSFYETADHKRKYKPNKQEVDRNTEHAHYAIMRQGGYFKSMWEISHGNKSETISLLRTPAFFSRSIQRS